MNTDYSVFWNEAQKKLDGLISTNDYNLWINRINFDHFEENNNRMVLSVPSNFIKDNVFRFTPDIESAISMLFGQKCTIDFVIKKINEKPESTDTLDDDIDSNFEILEVVKLKEEVQIQSKPKTIDETSEKPEDYSFESFVIGSSNEFAARAAKVVAENPGTEYNPFFIYGSSGLGKTHLLKSIEKYIKEHYPQKKVKYITSEEFGNEFFECLPKQQTQQFKLKYRQLDVLLLDDIQFFENKKALQEEIFHTFNQLYNDFKQMVFSCDQPINQVKNIDDRVRQRFGMGLNVDLIPPDFELRMAILKNESAIFDIKIENDALEYIATNVTGSIRELKSAFRILRAYYSIMRKKITLTIVKDKLKDKINEAHTSPLSVDTIISKVAEYYNLKSYDITGTKRTKSIVLARQVAMYLSRKETRLSTTQIGSFFGGKEHGTVMHATKKIDDMLNTSPMLKKDVENIIKSLN